MPEDNIVEDARSEPAPTRSRQKPKALYTSVKPKARGGWERRRRRAAGRGRHLCGAMMRACARSFLSEHDSRRTVTRITNSYGKDFGHGCTRMDTDQKGHRSEFRSVSIRVHPWPKFKEAPPSHVDL